MFKKTITLLFAIGFSFLSSHSRDIQKDRWIIMDFAWFKPATVSQQADTMLNRYMPIWKNASGDKGIILNFNWVPDIVTEYKGTPDQKLPFRSPNSAWWNDRTYSDIKKLIETLRSKAEALGLKNFHVGMECIAWPKLVSAFGKYNYPSDWSERHPELYSRYGVIDPLCKLKKDKYPYATRPKGIKEGEFFSKFFGDQWGELSRATGMDVILLWDSWATLKAYNRCGVFGDRASKKPAENKEISDAVIRTFRDIKNGNPQALLIGYSSGSSAIGEFRVNTFDLEALIADGSIDIWIDQTWGGAWNDFWAIERDGWTFQLAYQLQHALMIEAGNAKRAKPCKHYNIIAPLDAYEPWNIIHMYPNKLRWSIWAYNNAGIITPKGIKHIDGSVVAWCNSPTLELLSTDDVKLIAETTDSADASAMKTVKIFGASTVYNKKMMEHINAGDPASLNSEWIDEQSAMLMKWGIPCMSATRIEWLAQLEIEKKIWLYQTPGLLPDETIKHITGLSKTGCPQMFIGRAGKIDKALLQLAEISLVDTLYSIGDYVCLHESQAETGLPKKTNVYLSEHNPVKTADAVVFVRTPHTPLLTESNKSFTFYWQPPDWRHPSQSDLDQKQYGSIVPYYFAARELQRSACKKTGLTYVRPAGVMNPVAFHYWKSGSRTYFLFGNLETNSIGDSRTKREVFLYINKDELTLDKANYELKDYYGIRNMNAFGSDGSFLIYYLKIDPEGLGLYYLEN